MVQFLLKQISHLYILILIIIIITIIIIIIAGTMIYG